MAAELCETDLSRAPPDPEQCLGEFSAFEAVIDAGKTVAVTGGPCAGRRSIFGYAADTERIRLDPSDPPDELDGEDDPLLIDSCQHLCYCSTYYVQLL